MVSQANPSVRVALFVRGVEGTPAHDVLQSFYTACRDEVARPLFSAPSLDVFAERLDAALAHGASLRYRFILDILELPNALSRRVLRDVVSPPESMLEAIESTAHVLLGADSGTLVRALQATADLGILQDAFLAAAGTNSESRLSGLAELNAIAGAHDALYAAWALVLVGEVPVPELDIARSASTEFLRLALARRTALLAVIEGHTTEVSHIEMAPGVEAWLEGHPRLQLPYVHLIAIAASDRAIDRVDVFVERDRESDDEWLTLSAKVPADQWEVADARVRLLVERTGIVTWDDVGGTIVVSVEPT